MAPAKEGDTVKVHYTGTLKDGTVFDSSAGGDPLEFKLGDEQVIPGFEQAVVGMNSGDSKTITISSEEAYGPHRQELLMEIDSDQFPPDFKFEVGQSIRSKLENGQMIDLTVVKIAGTKVTLDANHPLSGEDLTFEIQLLEIL